MRAAVLDICRGHIATALDRLRGVIRTEEESEVSEADEEMLALEPV